MKTKTWTVSRAGVSGIGVWTSDIGVFGVTFVARLSCDHRESDDDAEELTEPDLARLTCQSWIAEASRLPFSALPCFSSLESCTGRPLICTVGMECAGALSTLVRDVVGNRWCTAP